MSHATSSAQKPATRDMTQHLQTAKYGDFSLTSAIRPSLDLQVVPRQGYRSGKFVDEMTGSNIPMLAAAVSEENLFECFLGLLDDFGEVVDVILESHHQRRFAKADCQEFLREHIDLPVLKSYLYEYEDLLLHDGCTGIAVIDPAGPSEIQFDDHKVLVVYSKNLRPFTRAFECCNISRDDELKLISEGEHLHSTCPEYADRFTSLSLQLGAEANSGPRFE